MLFSITDQPCSKVYKVLDLLTEYKHTHRAKVTQPLGVVILNTTASIFRCMSSKTMKP